MLERLPPARANGKRNPGTGDGGARSRSPGIRRGVLREGAGSPANARDGGSSAPVSARDQQGLVHGFSASPPPPFFDDVHGRRDRSAFSAATHPTTLGRHHRLYFPRRSGGSPCRADVPGI